MGAKMEADVEFNEWYKALEIYFSKRDIDYICGPDDWCHIEEWKEHHKKGLTPEQAFFEEC